MGFWRLFSCFGKIDSVVPGKLDDDDDDVVRSRACTQYNTLGLKGTGYIDREGLHNALTTIFATHGSLNFGITVYQGCLFLVVRW